MRMFPSEILPIDQPVQISLSDGINTNSTAVQTIALTTINSSPSLDDQVFQIPENSTAGTIAGQLINSDPDLIAPNSDTESFDILGGSGAGIFEIDADGVVRLSAGSGLDYWVKSNYSLFVQVTDGRGATDLALVEIDIINVTEIESTTINDGNSSRSNVESIEVQFDHVVALENDAFEIEASSGEIFNPIISLQTVDGRTLAKLTFAGEYAEQSGSIIDGEYSLRLRKEKVIPDSAVTLQDDFVDQFYRLFGDTDGDRDVDRLDLAAFGSSLFSNANDQDFNSQLDFDGDGDADAIDFARFMRNLNKRP